MLQIEYQCLTDFGSYLDRIGYHGDIEPTLNTLNALIYQHQCTVPFENLDSCDYHRPICLDIDHLFRKIVLNRRGGYCFELNGLFMALLRSLGFDAWSVFCRTAAHGTALRPINHRGIIVRINGMLYFCDVGFGGPMPPFAVRLSNEKQTAHGETYWTCPAKDEGWFLLSRLSGRGLGDDGEKQGSEYPVALFSLLPATEADFEPFSFFASTNQNSSFVRERKASLRTADGYINLRGDVLTICKNGRRTECRLKSEKIATVLKSQFGLSDI